MSSGILIGQKLARVEPREVAAKFEEVDWVASADVSRNWLNGKVIIELTERTPVALYKNQVIDSTGKTFVLRSTPSVDLVEIQAGNLSAAVAAVIFFVGLPDEIKSALRVIKVRSTGAIILEIDRGGNTLEIAWGTDTQTELKLKVFNALIELPENESIRRVDVSAPRAPIVK